MFSFHGLFIYDPENILNLWLILNSCLLLLDIQSRCFLYGFLHPVYKHGHLGVDPVVPRVRTAPPPGDHARQEAGGAVFGDQRTAVVATATLLVSIQVPDAQHVVGEVEFGFLGALGVLDDGDVHLTEDGGERAARGGEGVPPSGPLAPAGHGVVSDRQQLPFSKVFGGKADWDGVLAQKDRGVHPDQGDVAVACCLVVVFMQNHHINIKCLLCVTFQVQIVFTWSTKTDFILNHNYAENAINAI